MIRLIAATGLTLTLVACNTPTEKDYDDVATATAAVIADDGGELEGIEDVVDTARGRPPFFIRRSLNGAWTGQRGSIDYSYELTCRDAAGEVQDVCDESTESANAVLAWRGEIDTARRYANIERSGDWTLGSLTSSVATFNGRGEFSVDSEFEALARPVMRSFALDYDARYESILIDRTARRPIGGTITYAVDAARTESRRFRDIDASFQVDVVVTFSDDGTATMVLDGDRQYRVNLSNGDVVAMQ